MTSSFQTPEGLAVALAAHGSSHPGAQAALTGFAARVRLAWPRLAVHMAYTAAPRRGNHPVAPTAAPGLAGQAAALATGHQAQAPASLAAKLAASPPGEAPGNPAAPDTGRPLAALLAELAANPPRALVVQSLHVIAGDEYDNMLESLADFALTHDVAVDVNRPLLGAPADIKAVAAALAHSLPADMLPGEAAVFMGHGTTHRAQELYLGLAKSLAGGPAPVYLGVLEATQPGDPLGLSAILHAMRAAGITRARLLPLLTVSGRHANNDLAGDGPASWRTRLEACGIACLADLAGLVERERLAELWLGRLGRALEGRIR